MALRSFGLRGYIGELLVEYWLKHVYYLNQPGIDVISQVRPARVDPRGGPYLDIGVLQNGKVLSVYEVKTQDYALDKHFNINKSLRHLWDNPDNNETILSQSRLEYSKHPDFKAYLVLLVPPNADGQSTLKKNVSNILYFSDVISQIPMSDFRRHLTETLTVDAPGDLENLMEISRKHLAKHSQAKPDTRLP